MFLANIEIQITQRQIIVGVHIWLAESSWGFYFILSLVGPTALELMGIQYLVKGHFIKVSEGNATQFLTASTHYTLVNSTASQMTFMVLVTPTQGNLH